MKLKLALATLAMILPTACDKGDASNPPTSDSGAAASGDGGDGGGDGGTATEPGAPGVPWAEKTYQQRMEYMGIEVLPAMKTLFKNYDENQYKQFKCQTCHGDDMNEVKYKMPTDAIYPLNPDDPVKGAMEYDEKVTKFMIDEVVPKMTELLGEESKCMDCHPSE